MLLSVHRPPNVAAATASASRTGATSCTRNTLAPRSSASTFEATVPREPLAREPRQARPSVRPRCVPEEALARGADHDRAAEREQLVQAAQQLEVVLDGLAEADARVEQHPLAR